MGAIIDTFKAGGFVMYPLVLFSVIAIALMLERWAFWWKISNRQPRLVREVMNLYRRNQRAALFKLEQNADLPVARIFLAGLEIDDATPDEFRLALETAVAAEIPLLKRFTTMFDTIITLAPFLGLLGTVLGLIRLLSSIDLGDIGGTNTVGVGNGIAEALTSTATGLLVAILTLMISNVFRSLYLRQLSQIQEFGGQLELLQRRRYERGFEDEPALDNVPPRPQPLPIPGQQQSYPNP
ncbi:MotA/TolQ/ExbB proton channel family protein [Synechococcus sp. PCC 7336]|uniref:MotA/TolQ/ExbB proton channel family protein n=1 Tax=Synechococcus sp. PCC 7336 TaxID=195250 RepID=UPI000349A30B|nr:MotA/TolQ/ExbB proton channel family protein [Synechococcus sp. PCC 7336]